MRTRRYPWFQCILVLLVVSCGTKVTVTETAPSPKKLSPRAADQVEVFTMTPADRPSREIAVLEARRASSYSTESRSAIIDELRRVAGERGCDGIIIDEPDDTAPEPLNGTTTAYQSSAWAKADADRRYRASCIVFLPRQSSTSAPRAPAKSKPEPVPRIVCEPNQTQLCYGPGACRGAQACREDGSGWTACDCGSANSVDGGAPPPQPSGE